MTRPIALTVAVALLLVACSGGSDADRGASSPTTSPGSTATSAVDDEAPAGPEGAELTVVPLPDTVLAARYGNWTADGEGQVFSAVPKGSERVELYGWASTGATWPASPATSSAAPTSPS